MGIFIFEILMRPWTPLAAQSPARYFYSVYPLHHQLCVGAILPVPAFRIAETLGKLVEFSTSKIRSFTMVSQILSRSCLMRVHSDTMWSIRTISTVCQASIASRMGLVMAACSASTSDGDGGGVSRLSTAMTISCPILVVD